MLESHKNKHLWPKIDYLPHKNILVRVYQNQKSKDLMSNLKEYLKSWYYIKWNDFALIL